MNKVFSGPYAASDKIVFPVGDRQERCMIGAVSVSKNLTLKVGKVFTVANLPGPMVTKEFKLLVKHKLSKRNGQKETWEQR